MRKAETVISIALGVVLLVAVLVVEREGQYSGSLRQQASPAAEPAPKAAGDNPAVVPPGYEPVRTYRLGAYHADVYRASPLPLDFGAARLVIYDHAERPVLKLEGLESTKTPWTVLYDFHARHGVEPVGRQFPPAPPSYLKSLTGDGKPDVIIGQFSGGERCCTTVTVVELGPESVRTVGRIEGLPGLPFEALEVRKLDRRPDWQLVAHRRYPTLCGSSDDPADVPTVYAYSNGGFAVEAPRYAAYFEAVLRRNLARWARKDQRSIGLLSTLALDYAGLGRKQESQRFLTANLSHFVPQLKAAGVEPQTCTAYLEKLADQLAGDAGKSRTVPKGAGGGGR